MKPIISYFNKNEKAYPFLKLGFITRLIEEKEIIDSKSILSEPELTLHNEYLKKIEAYKKNVGWIIKDVNGTVIKDISSIFFSEKIFYDSDNFAIDISVGRSFFIGGYLGALVYLSSISKNKEKVLTTIKRIVKKYNTTPSPIAQKWGFSDLDNRFIINWMFFVEFLINRKISGYNDFLTAIDELLIIQNNINYLPEFKKLISNLQEKVDSIKYAKRIQESLLPKVDSIKKRINSFNVFYKPKDILSGDFYLYKEIGDTIIIGCGDCTGHGIPGSLLTVLSINIIDHILDSNEKTLSSPSLLISELDNAIIKSLNRNLERNDDNFIELLNNLSISDKYNPNESVSLIADGLELAICFINKKKKEIVFSGAGLPLYVLNNNYVSEIKQRNNKGIGGLFKLNKPFEETKLSINNDDVFILTTDGILDQFGGDAGNKLMKKRFIEILQTLGSEKLNSSLHWSFFLDAWLNGLSFQKIQSDFKNQSFTFGDIMSLNHFEQIDDITIISFQV